MEDEIGFAKDSADEFKNRNCIHMDAFRFTSFFYLMMYILSVLPRVFFFLHLDG